MRLTFKKVLINGHLLQLGTGPVVACGNETYMYKGGQDRYSASDRVLGM
jgi:hypothetical protein